MARKSAALLSAIWSPLAKCASTIAFESALVRSRWGCCRNFAASAKSDGPTKPKARGRPPKVKEEPKKPKAALSGFRIFQSSAGTAVLAKHPEATTIADKSKVLAAAWKLLTEAERQTYNDQAAASKLKASPPPRSAYSLFQREAGKEILAKHPHASIGDCGRILAAEWKKLSDPEKQRWHAELERLKPAKKKQPVKGYATYVRDNFSRVSNGNSSLTAQDVMRELASVWKTLDAGEKQKYLKQ